MIQVRSGIKPRSVIKKEKKRANCITKKVKFIVKKDAQKHLRKQQQTEAKGGVVYLAVYRIFYFEQVFAMISNVLRCQPQQKNNNSISVKKKLAVTQ